MRPLLASVLLCALPFAAVAADPAPPTSGTGAAPQPDQAVGRLLDSLGYKHETDEDGDYKLVFGLGEEKDSRSQLVFVRSPIETYGSHRVREVWSPGYLSDRDAFPADVANRLLEASQENKLGSWVKQGRYAVFVVRLPADASASQLDDALEAAMQSADQMEAELTPGKDEL